MSEYEKSDINSMKLKYGCSGSSVILFKEDLDSFRNECDCRFLMAMI